MPPIATPFLAAVVAMLGFTMPAVAASASPVDIQIIDDAGNAFPVYPVRNSDRRQRAYLEAIRDSNYRIRVRNSSGRRVGLVIAVDGRNIISGKQSELARNEQMYVLEPYGRAVYSGWRTDRSNVHRFFFTDAGSSYSAAFGDYSAMGVIAVAVFDEVRPKPVRQREQMKQQAPAAAGRATGDADAAAGLESEQAGTGFGDREYSPTVQVDFRPKRRASRKLFFKYEWRQRLCDRDVIECDGGNRFWPDDVDYAPYPPGYSQSR